MKTLKEMKRSDFKEMRRKARIFPEIKKKTVQQKQAESIPLEQEERRQYGIPSSSYATADRTLNTIPIDRNSQLVLSRPRVKGGPRKTILYVVRFTHLTKNEIVFLKVGITNHSLDVRFANDVGRYRIDQVGKIEPLSRRDALLIEQCILEFLKNEKARPVIPLISGGNSECFAYTEQLEKTLQGWISSMAERLLRK